MPAFRSISRQGRTSVLLTGFGPFPGTPVNATMVLVPALAAAVQRAFPDVAVTAEILPTEWERAPSRVDARLDEAQPDISLHFGVSSRARGFEIEARGRNFRKDVADASGACPPECAVRDGAPEHLAARLPVAEIVTRMRRRGIAANVSWDAGGYLCNAVLYHVLAAARSRPELRRTGFVHVPTGLAALHVAGMVARHLRDRVRNARGTRLVNGNALIARMAYEAFRRDVRLWLQAPVVDLVRQGDRVCGAIVERNGARVRIAARRGVVLACGGFPGSEALTRQLYPHIIAGRNHQRLPPAGNTGDGLRLAQSVGGRLESDVHHPAAWAPVSLVPKEGGRTVPFPHFFERGKPGYIAVDRRGRRFVNEAQSYHVFVPAMIEACRGDSDVAAWIVCDHRAIRGFGLGALGPAPMRIAPHLASGYILRGATPAELAQKAGIDPAGLEATISTFNADATHGEDREFGRGSDAYQRFNGAPGHQPNPCLAPLATPPYYAVRVVPGELGTFAGIGTDRHGRVLGQEKTPVAGLYAVGNDAVSVMGGTYPGAGITIGPAMTFGYIAARHIAEDVTA